MHSCLIFDRPRQIGSLRAELGHDHFVKTPVAAARAEPDDIDVIERRWCGEAVEMVPHGIAHKTHADPPIWQVECANGFQYRPVPWRGGEELADVAGALQRVTLP